MNLSIHIGLLLLTWLATIVSAGFAFGLAITSGECHARGSYDDANRTENYANLLLAATILCAGASGWLIASIIAIADHLH